MRLAQGDYRWLLSEIVSRSRPGDERAGGRWTEGCVEDSFNWNRIGLTMSLQPNSSATRPVYGQELILDLHGCEPSKFTRQDVHSYFEELCSLIDMERCKLHFWDDVGVPEKDRQTHPKTRGTSAVQFILTSTIVIHTLDLMEAAYVNIFSCKEFDTEEAARFTANWFRSADWSATVVIRR